MTTCKNCLGDGIVGVGDKPWLKEGPQSTCTVCSGTGQVEDGSVESVPETPAEEPAPVDNSQSESFSEGSSDESSSPVEPVVPAEEAPVAPVEPSEPVAPESEQVPS